MHFSTLKKKIDSFSLIKMSSFKNYCPCGQTFTSDIQESHYASKKHQNYLANLKSEILTDKVQLQCDCGSIISKSSQASHLKSNKHAKWAESNKPTWTSMIKSIFN